MPDNPQPLPDPSALFQTLMNRGSQLSDSAGNQMKSAVNTVRSSLPSLPPALPTVSDGHALAMADPMMQLFSYLQRGGQAIQNAIPPDVRAKIDSLLTTIR